MTLSMWALLGIALAVAAVAGGIGFIVGRRTATDTQRIELLEAELATQRAALEKVNAGINAHFEESAKLFGQLAQDYRAFFDHFTDSATALGLSERRTEMIREAVETKLLPSDAEAEAAVEVAEVELPTDTANIAAQRKGAIAERV